MIVKAKKCYLAEAVFVIILGGVHGNYNKRQDCLFVHLSTKYIAYFAQFQD